MKYSTYQDLLEYAESECDSFSLVWRSEFNFQKSAWDITDKLSKHLINELPVNKWPGTEIFDGKALLRTYSINAESIAILKSVSSVFDWLAPGYPEDLAFYKNENVVFVSIAHEGEAWFET
jgi:hypothetical protein